LFTSCVCQLSLKNNLYDDDNDDEKYIKTKKPEMRKVTHFDVPYFLEKNIRILSLH